MVQPPSNVVALMLPTCFVEDDWPLYALSGEYVLVALLALLEVARALGRGASLVSFRTLTLLLIWLTMTGRAVLTSVIIPWPAWWLLILSALYMPVFLQFFTFSVLVTFLAKAVLCIRGSEARLPQLYSAYGLMIWLLLIGMCVLASALDTPRPPDYDVSAASFATVLFGSLAAVFGVVGYKLYAVLKKISLSQQKMAKCRVFVRIMTVYTSVFVLRLSWDFCYFLGINRLQGLMNRWNNPGNKTELHNYFIGTLTFYTLVEVVPAITLVAVFFLYLPCEAQRREPNTPERDPLYSHRITLNFSASDGSDGKVDPRRGMLA